jgi:DNA repair protein RadA/Sms
MAKSSGLFVCGNCGHEELKWMGQCPGCREWNSFQEMKIPAKGKAGKSGGYSATRPTESHQHIEAQPLSRIESASHNRLEVEPEEISRVLGGGLVIGSVNLLGGEPGVGKSTLLTGLALQWAKQGVRVLYVAGEESPSQIKMRAERLGFNPKEDEGFLIIDQCRLEPVLELLYNDRAANPGPAVMICDSIQTMHSENIDAHPGSVGQIRYCGGVLSDFARTSKCPIFLVGHVTKSGTIAGPKILEHMVDTVLYFEGDGGGPIRMVRAVKNRFGATGELAIMEMCNNGLIPVSEAGALFLSQRQGGEPGSCVTAVRNGSRVFLVEVQALVSPSRYGTPQRVVQGIDSKRVALLAAILEKRAGVDLGGCDIFVKVAGGAKLDDPGADLAILVAMASSLREIPVPNDTLVLGEVGLTGTVRRVTDQNGRAREAAHHGMKVLIGAKDSRKTIQGLKLVSAETVGLAIEAALNKSSRGQA